MGYDEFTYLDEDATQFTYFDDKDATQLGGDASSQEDVDVDYRPLKVGSLFLDKYRILRVLGNGNFGMIYLLEANDASKKLLVAKEFFPKGFVTRGADDTLIIKSSLSKRELKSFHFMKDIFIGEAKNLVKATEKSHPNIVTFFALEENWNNTTYFIMNYEEGISLKAYLAKREKKKEKKLSNDAIYRIALPLLDGLKQIHKAGVFHQDIKLENILIRDDGSPILLDFGASVILYDEETQRYFNAATPRYAAIEQINVDQPPKINQTSDIYATGVLLYKLITDTFPLKSKERLDAIVKGKKDPYKPLISQKLNAYDTHLLKAVDKALQISQDDRFQDAQAFMDALKNKKKLFRYLLFGILFLGAVSYFAIPQKEGKIKLQVGEKGYAVYIDSKKVVLNKDRTTSLETGRHKIVVTKDGYVPYEKSILIKEDGIVNLSIDLTPMQQVVTVETDVADATIVLNGRTLKNNVFSARYGDEYKLKIIAKDREALEQKFDYATLAENGFKLYYKLVINKVTATISVSLPAEMGVTKIKVNNEPLREWKFTAKKGKKYTISISNPYYEPLIVARSFDELFAAPQQHFTLSQGEGKIIVAATPSNTKATVYRIIDEQEIQFNKKPYTVTGSTSIILPATDKVYMMMHKEGHKSVRSRVFSLRHNAVVKKQFDLGSNKKVKSKNGSSVVLAQSDPLEGSMISISGVGFKVSQYEITYEAFARFLNSSELAQKNKNANGYRLYGGKLFKYIVQRADGYIVNRSYKNYPAAYITWYGAKAYTEWLSRQTQKHYALPTAKQWSRVANIGFSASNVQDQANYNSGILLQRGLKAPASTGLYDLFGNVFEWTETSSGDGKHIIKGGSYRSKKSFLYPNKSSSEYNGNAKRGDLGFRVILYPKR